MYLLTHHIKLSRRNSSICLIFNWLCTFTHLYIYMVIYILYILLRYTSKFTMQNNFTKNTLFFLQPYPKFKLQSKGDAPENSHLIFLFFSNIYLFNGTLTPIVKYLCRITKINSWRWHRIYFFCIKFLISPHSFTTQKNVYFCLHNIKCTVWYVHTCYICIYIYIMRCIFWYSDTFIAHDSYNNIYTFN